MAANLKLVDAATGAEIALPAKRTCWDGYEIEITAFRPSTAKGMPGYITTSMNETYVPSVCGAKIIEFPGPCVDERVGAAGSLL